MLIKAISCGVLLFCINSASAYTLCQRKEEVVVSFEGQKTKKLISVCKGKASTYLVYRFGTAQKVEFQFPAELNKESWRQFTFSSYHRDGGKQNAALGMSELYFTNGDAEYTVSENWDSEDDSSNISITVRVGKKILEIGGNKKTQNGSLQSLVSEDSIKNTFGE